MAKLTAAEFENFFEYYQQQEHQVEAIHQLHAVIPDALLDDKAEWIQTYRNPKIDTARNPLKVPYQSQRDNTSGTGNRECFSSSAAMIAMYYGKIENDDEYNHVRARYGDTTSAEAQVKALKSLGLEARFITTGSTTDLTRMLKEERPIAVGWLHYGTPEHPAGGGHWSVVIGEVNETSQPDCWMVHDPFGSADLKRGGYTNTHGAGRYYAKCDWNPRWEVEGPGSGWMLDVWDPAKK